MEEQVNSFKLSPPPDPHHHHRVLLYGLGAIFLLIIAGIIGFSFGLNNIPPFPIFMNNKQIPTVPYLGTEAKIVDPQIKFSINLFQELSHKDNKNNIFISPLSINMALDMVSGGANGMTKSAMNNVLNLQGLQLEQINQANADLLLDINNDKDVTLSMANSLWIQQKSPVNQQFLNTTQKYYGATVQMLNFSDPSSAQTINNWVRTNTNGKILQVVAPPLPADAFMYLVNAIYFKGTWADKFDVTQTQNATFTMDNGQTETHPMMTHFDTYPYYETDIFQAVSLPYGKQKQITMDVFLPKQNLKDFLTALSYQNWTSWINALSAKSGTVILPKFTMKYQKDLKPDLSALGMRIAFDRSQADFGGLLQNTSQRAWIDSVTHSSYIDVDEEGTTAAAATNVGVGITTLALPVQNFVININHPLFFDIRDTKSGAILFMGTILQP